MKKREEMIRDVHDRINKYEEERKTKRAKMAKISATIIPVCIVAVIGAVLWNGDKFTSGHGTLISNNDNTTDSGALLSAELNQSENDVTGKAVTSSAEIKQESKVNDKAVSEKKEGSEPVIKNNETDDSPEVSNISTAVSNTESVKNPESVNNTEINQVTKNTERPLVSEHLSAKPDVIYYSSLVKNTKAPELDGYDSISASIDVDIFDETLLPANTEGIIEGEIIDMWTNTYEYATASDKFEPNGRLYHKDSTVAYKVRVDRVLSGNFSVGDEVTIEDVYFPLDSVISVKKGSRYVIPFYKWEGILYEPDEIVSGSNVLDSCYSTYYQFHPQIEKVDGGYVVPNDWKTLINDECSEIVMDVDSYMGFCDSMYYVPDDIFNQRMNVLLQNS